MNSESRGRNFPIAQKIYGALLRAYPQAHRADYGTAMAQLFRDQCRDAWGEARGWGLLKLWLRVLPDLASTSIMERLAALNERKSMNEKLASLSSFQTPPAKVFSRVFVVVFLIVFTVSVAVTFLLPESYASTATVKVENEDLASNGERNYDPYFIQTTFEIIQSELVLKPVVEKLNLNVLWGKKYFAGEKCQTSDTVNILKVRLQLSPVRGTKLIRITVFSDDKHEAAQIANAVADSYADYRKKNDSAITTVSVAALATRYAAQENEINQKQARLNELQKQFNIPDYPEGLEQQVKAAEASFIQTKSQLEKLHSLDKKGQRELLPMLVTNTGLASLLDKFHDEERKYAVLANDYAPNHAVMLRAATSVSVLDKQVDDCLLANMVGLNLQLESKKTFLSGLNSQLQKSKPTTQTEVYWSEKRHLDELLSAQKLLFSKLQAGKIELQLPSIVAVQVTDTAEPSMSPTKPNKTLNIALGGFFGILLAGALGGVAFLIAKLRRRNRAAAALAGS